jgi:multidrug efflux system membrane fusion protein
MKMKLPLVAGATVLVGIAIYQAWHHAVPVALKTTSAEATSINVSVASAERRDLPILVKASGRAEAKASVTVKSRLDGQVAAILFTEGKAVSRGQVLIRMDPAPSAANLRQTKALVARDEAQLEKLVNDFQRNTALFDQGFISKSGLGQTQADLHAAQATLKADQANVDTARLQLEFTNVVSPVDGIAGAALLPAGGSAKANDTALVVVNQVQPIYVSFSVPEIELARLKHAMAKGIVPVTTSVPGSGADLSGKLVFIDNAVDPTTGAILAKASFANDNGELTPGQFAVVKIPVDRLSSAIVVPARAVESGLTGPFVFVMKLDSTVEIRQITVVAEVDGFSAVSSGLAPGERVVTDGQAHLRAGSRVNLASAPPGGALRSP